MAQGIVTHLAGDMRLLLSEEELMRLGIIWGPEIRSTKQLTVQQVRAALNEGERLGELGVTIE